MELDLGYTVVNLHQLNTSVADNYFKLPHMGDTNATKAKPLSSEKVRVVSSAVAAFDDGPGSKLLQQVLQISCGRDSQASKKCLNVYVNKKSL